MMNAIVNDLEVYIDEGVHVSVLKGFEDEIRPYDIYIQDPHITLHLTAAQARELLSELADALGILKEEVE